MLPVSLQVLEAGDGGGGISSLSAVSLWFGLFTTVVLPFPLDSRLSVFVLDTCVPAGNILNLQVASTFHAADSNCPTFGTPLAIVNPEKYIIYCLKLIYIIIVIYL